ncbi:MAG: hypothetical protein JXR97_16565 [Planctomycetes bacterium]|nr:hypothetical protein [Planctomycetota bacterium]
MAKKPSRQWYPADWLKDPALSMCSPATRGIWMDMLCAMHELDEGGEVCGTYQQLARICRCNEAEIEVAIAELAATNTADVTERHGKVTVINRRMSRECHARKSDAQRQARKRVKGSGGDDVTEKSQPCHGHVTEKSRLHSSSSSSSSSSSPSEEEEKIPEKKELWERLRRAFPELDRLGSAAVLGGLAERNGSGAAWLACVVEMCRREQVNRPAAVAEVELRKGWKNEAATVAVRRILDPPPRANAVCPECGAGAVRVATAAGSGKRLIRCDKCGRKW